jgi:hypothetical protein
MGGKKKLMPSKGTKRRAMLLKLLQPRGLTAQEAVDAGLAKDRTCLNSAADRLYEDYGYDVRCFKVPNPNHNPHQRGSKKHLAVYRVVGRYRDRGGYRSFTSEATCDR